jgi:PAS domain S-box-containing protein
VAGWSYAPIVIDEVLATLDLPEQLVWLSLRDAGTAPAEARFFASPGAEPVADGLPAVDLPIVMFDRRWIAHVRARPALVAELRLTPPWLVAAAGAFGATLLGGVAFLLAQRGQRMRRLQLERAERAAIVDASDDGIVGLRLDGTITGWNRGAERLFGFAAAEVLGKPIKTVLPRAEWLQEDTALHASLAAGKRVAPFETQRRHRDGTLLDVSVGAAPIHDAGGRLVAMAKTYRDIGASRAERNSLEELNLSLDRQVRARTESLDQALRDLRNIVDALPSMIGYWDGALRNRMANRAYAGWFGRAPQELAGRHMTELVASDVYEMNRPHAEAALRGEPQTFQRTLPRPGGGTFHGLAHYLPDVVNGVVRGFYVLVHDVTELQEQRALLEAEKRDKAGLLAIIDTHMIVSTTDRDGVISAVNERFCRVSGYTAAELVGRTHRVVGSGTHPPAFWREMWRTIGTGAIWHGEVCNRARDGAPYWLDTVIAPFLDEHGRIEKIVAVRSDVSGRKRAELELRQALATLESILASATQVAIVATDLGGIVTLFNRGAECLLGYDAAEVTGRVDVLRWYLPDELEARRADLGLHGGAPATPFQALTGDAAIDRPFDCHYRRKDGSLVPVTSSTARILDADRGLLGYIHVAYDRRRRPRS